MSARLPERRFLSPREYYHALWERDAGHLRIGYEGMTLPATPEDRIAAELAPWLATNGRPPATRHDLGVFDAAGACGSDWSCPTTGCRIPTGPYQSAGSAEFRGF